MTAFIRHIAAVAVTATFALAAPAQAQREVKNAPDPFVHRVAGVAFPKEPDGFRRYRVTESGEAGATVEVMYESLGSSGLVAILLRPLVGVDCRGYFEKADLDVDIREGAALRKDAAPLRLIEESTQQQFSSGFALYERSGEEAQFRGLGFLWVGCFAGEKWAVSYRGVYEGADEALIASEAQKLFAGIDWSPLAPR